MVPRVGGIGPRRKPLFGPGVTYVTLTLGAAAFLILGVSYFLVSCRWEALFQVAAVPTLLAGLAILRLSVSDK